MLPIRIVGGIYVRFTDTNQPGMVRKKWCDRSWIFKPVPGLAPNSGHHWLWHFSTDLTQNEINRTIRIWRNSRIPQNASFQLENDEIVRLKKQEKAWKFEMDFVAFSDIKASKTMPFLISEFVCNYSRSIKASVGWITAEMKKQA